MKILIGTQIKNADQYTIAHQPIGSLDLMEKASAMMAQWIEKNIDKNKRLFFLIGKGNNGGDGLAMARMLHHKGFLCIVYIHYPEKEFTIETNANFHALPTDILVCYSLDNIDKKDVIIDCLLGTGLHGDLRENITHLISQINSLQNKIIAIDIPSGMKTEWNNNALQIIHADITLTLQFPKLAMLLPEAGECCGTIHILPIGLDKQFLETADTPYTLVTEEFVKTLLVKRKKFGYKNEYGHALLICGSEPMQGAAMLATGGALKSGCGLVTTHIPSVIQGCMMSHFPSAMLSIDAHKYFSSIPENIEQYTTIGIGCGLGKSTQSIRAFSSLLSSYKNPMVIDADALNMIALDRSMMIKIPTHSILTPHLGELKRLVGEWYCEEEKIKLAVQLSINYKVVILVKGAYSMIACADGKVYFNNTGNCGMAKGGSGDVLTGIVTGLLARGYDSVHATLIGVYVHGLAGDIAAQKLGIESMNSQDIMSHLPEAFKTIYE